MIFEYIVVIIVAYLLGAIPMGLILTRLMGKGDLRQVGSGNIGATNVLRVGGLRAAAATWVLDMAKVIAAVLIGMSVGGDVLAAWAGFAAVVGHCYPIWLRFRGGKGISALFGILLVSNPLAFLVCGVEWLVVALSTGYSSLGAVVVFCLMPILGFVTDWRIGLAYLTIRLLCCWRHRANISRLLNGTESKIEWKWKK